jgi:hypothetical protein
MSLADTFLSSSVLPCHDKSGGDDVDVNVLLGEAQRSVVLAEIEGAGARSNGEPICM